MFLGPLSQLSLSMAVEKTNLYLLLFCRVSYVFYESLGLYASGGPAMIISSHTGQIVNKEEEMG